MFSFLTGEKIGERIVYKESDMTPSLIPISKISQEVVSYWNNTYDKQPIFMAEMLYEIPSSNVDMKEVSKILRSFSTMEGIEYYSTHYGY